CAKNIFAKQSHDLSFCVLGMSYFVIVPKCLRNYTLLDLRQVDLGSWHIISILTPPNSTIGIHFSKLLLGNSPVRTLWRAFDDTTARAYDWICPSTVKIASSQVIRSPKPSWIVVRILVCLVLFLSPRHQVGNPLVFVLGIEQQVVMI